MEKEIDEKKQGQSLVLDQKEGNTKKLFIESYGCQMNFSDSEIVASILYENGYNTTQNLEDADLVLVNTCSIRDKAEQTIRKRLEKYNAVKKINPTMKVGVLGCMAERLKSQFLEEEKIVDIVVGPDAYKDLQFLWFNKTWKASSLSLLALNNGVPVMEDSVQVSKYSQTLGGRFIRKFEKWSVATNLYYQTGKHTNGKEISALNFMAEATLKMGITAGYEYLSGNSYDKNDKVYAFTPFYGTNHKFNGFMDYFYVSNHINSVGLNPLLSDLLA